MRPSTTAPLVASSRGSAKQPPEQRDQNGGAVKPARARQPTAPMRTSSSTAEPMTRTRLWLGAVTRGLRLRLEPDIAMVGGPGWVTALNLAARLMPNVPRPDLALL